MKLLLTTALISSAAGLAASSPNFVFILADDMGWTGTSQEVDSTRHDSKSDYYLTLNIEKLAAQGVCFSHAYAPSPLCSPSRASFLTGKSPAQLHLTNPGRARNALDSHKLISAQNINELPAGELTLAEVLKAKHYSTAHFGKWHLGAGGPGLHGFDQHDGDTGNDGPGIYDDPNPKDIFGITQRAQTFIADNAKAGKPFYLQLSHYAVHSPVKASQSALDRFGSIEPGTIHNDKEFAAMTYDLDSSIGMILDTLRKFHLTDSTYVIFMSDNGSSSKQGTRKNAPLNGGKGSLWEGGIRVPLIVTGPNIKANRNLHSNIVGYDLFPTILELAGIDMPQPSSIEGRSFVPALCGKPIEKRAPMIFHYPHYGKGPKQKPQSAYIDGDYKVIKFYETDNMGLFNLRKDIGEQNDLSGAYPEKAEQMLKDMFAYLNKIGAQLPAINPNYDPAAVSTGAGSRKGAKSGGFIGRMDQDGDGKVSRKEFSGPANRFPRLDSNSDGYIDPTEAPTGPPRKK